LTPYAFPELINVNAKSRLFRDRRKLLIIGRCVEVEHPDALKPFSNGYAVLSACLEEEHVNKVGFKLAGVLARGDYEEVSVLTVDGSLHCVQLHYMVEEVFKVLGNPPVRRRHFVIEGGRVVEVPCEAVKASRYLSRVAKLLRRC